MDPSNLPATLAEYTFPTISGYGTTTATTPQTGQIQTTANMAWPMPRAVRLHCHGLSDPFLMSRSVKHPT